jgi:hypothetical protein
VAEAHVDECTHRELPDLPDEATRLALGLKIALEIADRIGKPA